MLLAAHCDDSVYYAHVVSVPDTGIETLPFSRQFHYVGRRFTLRIGDVFG